VDASRTAIADAMREGGQRTGAGAHGGRLRMLSIVAQVVACVVLLVAAGLFTRSLARMEDTDVGFDARHVLNVGVSAIQAGYDEAQATELFTRIEDRLRALPGVEEVSFASVVPLGYVRLGEAIEIEGETTPPSDRPIAGLNVVSPSYFATLRIPIVEGRAFTESDSSDHAPVAIVNRQFAARLWPDTDAVGRRFRFSNSSEDWIQVVGVTPTGRYHSIAEDPFPFVYLPRSQHPQPFQVVHARTTSSPGALLPLVVRTIRDVEPAITPIDVMTMEQSLAGGFGFFLPRLTARFAGLLALLAVALAVVGLYGLVSHSASRRTREIGIRMALGATPGNVLTLVVREAAMLIAVGLTTGMVVASLAARLLADFLVGVSARDPMTFLSVAALLVAVSLSACALPAIRAIRVEPIAALREE
jgi:putative ABC transport system permease protein